MSKIAYASAMPSSSSSSMGNRPFSAMVAHTSAALDAASFIIAMGLVDIITFGRPVQASDVRDDRIGSESGAGEWSSSSPPPQSAPSSRILWSAPVMQTPRRVASDPGQPIAGGRRSSSGARPPSPAFVDAVEQHSSSSATRKRTGWWSRGGSLDGYSGAPSSPVGRRSSNSSSSGSSSHLGTVGGQAGSTGMRRSSSSVSKQGEGGLHHYQRKIFSKQMQRTARIQPHVRNFIIVLCVVTWLFSMMLVALMLLQGVRPALATTMSISLSPIRRLGTLSHQAHTSLWTAATSRHT